MAFVAMISYLPLLTITGRQIYVGLVYIQTEDIVKLI
jgi:hypothetical protein